MREIPFFYGKDVHDAWAERGRTFNPWAGIGADERKPLAAGGFVKPGVYIIGEHCPQECVKRG